MPTSTATSPASQLSLPAYYWRLVSATDAAGKSIPTLQPGVEHQLRLAFTKEALNIRGAAIRSLAVIAIRMACCKWITWRPR
ncbi:hypothetical protein [Achromobacter spanius]|uniref:hypothetical protein n=1 Tax=Achromobacter spanius TaxID=217203 RepID=UPI00227CE747|nr:hypothetical protein [Achromobacter spanius]WAI83024.1 hypothetical protein N8Z00_26580 [Achromobacter spanius]